MNKCFLNCKNEDGMKYFALMKGNLCFCAPVPPGEDIGEKKCDSACSGDADEMCGGAGGAASMFTMLDGEKGGDKEIKEDMKADKEKLLAAYSSFDAGCSHTDSNLQEIN